MTVLKESRPRLTRPPLHSARALQRRASHLQHLRHDTEGDRRARCKGPAKVGAVQVAELFAVASSAQAEAVEHLDELLGLPAARALVCAHELAPAENIAEVEFPRAARECKDVCDVVMYRHVEVYHAPQQVLADIRVRSEGDEEQVFAIQLLHANRREAVEEGRGQAFAAAALVQRVLRGKDAE